MRDKERKEKLALFADFDIDPRTQKLLLKLKKRQLEKVIDADYAGPAYQQIIQSWKAVAIQWCRDQALMPGPAYRADLEVAAQGGVDSAGLLALATQKGPRDADLEPYAYLFALVQLRCTETFEPFEQLAKDAKIRSGRFADMFQKIMALPAHLRVRPSGKVLCVEVLNHAVAEEISLAKLPDISKCHVEFFAKQVADLLLVRAPHRFQVEGNCESWRKLASDLEKSRSTAATQPTEPAC
jgi:hypothetical protein